MIDIDSEKSLCKDDWYQLRLKPLCKMVDIDSEKNNLLTRFSKVYSTKSIMNLIFELSMLRIQSKNIKPLNRIKSKYAQCISFLMIKLFI